LDILKNTANTIYFSQISLLEITIKQKIGKLPLFNATIEEIYTQAIADGFTFYPLQTNTFSITIISQYLNNTETHLIDYY